ncbi:unnamed protein product, partial [marine sediment metagenome]
FEQVFEELRQESIIYEIRLLFTHKPFYISLFPGRKVSNDDGLSMVSAVRTFTLPGESEPE